MIAGRLHWRPAGARLAGRVGLAALDFPGGTLTLTEAGTRRRASIHLARGEAALAAHDPGGLDVLGATAAEFRARSARERHTLRRALTDPRLLDGIGNAYADEILHRARLSPVRMTDRLDERGAARGSTAPRSAVLGEWAERLSAAARLVFPEKVTAFREGMAVHGRYGQPCPDCGAPVQRIVHAENETNYCARLPDGRAAPGRSRPLAPPPPGLAAHPRGDWRSGSRAAPRGSRRARRPAGSPAVHGGEGPAGGGGRAGDPVRYPA